MGRNTKIGWANDSWNPWKGCKKVSEGCRNCYMYRMVENPKDVRRADEKKFNAPLGWAKNPKNRGRFVFTCSLSDFFIPEADEWRGDAWDIIRRTPELCYQILTKRPENIADRLPPDWNEGYENVWLGVSAENQDTAEKRLPELLSIPAQLHFVSYEPALEEINLTRWLDRIGWVICGGETDYQNPRPMETDWAQSIRDQCTAFNVPFFLKQLGGTPHNKRADDQAILDGQLWQERPEFYHEHQLSLF